MQLSEQKIKTIKAFFTDKPVKKAYLFGSWARKEASQNSDVDILVDLDYASQISLMGFVGMKQELEKQLKLTVDLVSENGLSKIIRPFVEADKLLIYEK